MAQLRVVNRGGSPAYDIRLKWDQPLYDNDGREAVLGIDGTIPVLAPSESASVSLGVSHAFLAKAMNTTRRGRISYSNIAGELRIPESTVRHRLNRLVRGGIVEFAALTNPLKLGYQIWAIIEVQAELRKIRPVAQQLAGGDRVRRGRGKLSIGLPQSRA